MKLNPFAIAFVFAALFGLVFTGFSTSDFVAHLDRQVHAIHCSFVPGLATLDTSGSSGCHVALMSSYSSFARSLVWGGIPWALLGMGTFAFLLFRGVELFVNRRGTDPGAALVLVGFSLIPVITSLVMGGIAVFVLGEVCKVCAGIYLSSFVAFASAIGAWWWARGEALAEPPANPLGPLGYVLGATEAALFVIVPVGLFLATAPDHSKFAGTCGALAHPEAPMVTVPIGPHPGKKVAIEVFDPLCPACRGFEERLSKAGLADELDRKAVLFPLDSTCNWMVTTSMHPGACAISEAVICAGDAPGPVIAWAFAHQEEIVLAAKQDPASAAAKVKAEFPALAACVGSADARQKLNRGLRWAVKNELPVLTPQLYVDNKKLCDEDTDLGMDFALARLVKLDAGGAP